MMKPLFSRMGGGSLRTRVLVLVLAALACVGTAGWIAFSLIVQHLTAGFGAMIAERQVQYDRYRGMAALNRELSLAESLATAPAIRAWLANENDPALKARGLAEMDHYRQGFADRTVFIVADASGNYYFNDAQNSYGDAPLSYTLDASLERDAWYFATRARREGCYPNVNVDDVLGVTNVWINCLVTDGPRVLGMVGTGLDLSSFIREVVDITEPGIDSIFVDQSGAVQAHRDAALVDFRSITKDIADKTTIFSLVDSQADTAILRGQMDAARADPARVNTSTLMIDGAPRLVGVGYLPHIGWYNITVTDPAAIIDRKLFWPIGAAVIFILLAVAAALSLIFRQTVLKRLEKVEAGLVAVREGKRATMVPDRSDDEIGRLSRTLIEMSDAITEARIDLETQVRQRTEQLQSLVNLDDLTKISNRRGFEEKFRTDQRRQSDSSTTDGLMLIDIDHFKRVNDTAGHAAGDQVVIEVARRLTLALRRIDLCGRWGGDEFIVLIRDADASGLARVASALHQMMRQKPVMLSNGQSITVTISLGAVIVAPGTRLDVATDMADAALYRAKEDGRDRVVLFDGSGALQTPAPDLADAALQSA